MITRMDTVGSGLLDLAAYSAFSELPNWISIRTPVACLLELLLRLVPCTEYSASQLPSMRRSVHCALLVMQVT